MKRVLVIVGTVVLLGYAVIVGLNRPQPKPKPFVFQKTAIILPPEVSALPPGPNAAAVTAACTACHSASMILTQPRLTRAQWTTTVTKMREVYKAPIADAEIPAILDYLDGVSAAPPR